MDGPAFLDGLVASITSILSGGYSRLSTELKEILSVMVGLDLMLAALAWLGAYLELFQRFGMAVIKLFLWATIFFSYPVLTQSFVDYCIWGGLTAGGLASGTTLTVEEFRKPSTVVMKGFEATAPINKFIQHHTGWRSIMGNLMTLGMMSLGALGIWAAFVVMTIHLVFVLITLEIVLAFAVIFVVFGAFGPMAFLAIRAFGLIVASAVRLGVAALVTGLMFPFVDQFFLPTGQDPDMYAGAWLLIGSWLIVFLSWIIPALAHSFFAGGPSLGAGNLLPGLAVARMISHSGSGSSHAPAPVRAPANPDEQPIGRMNILMGRAWH